jgi:hypothetical protein
MNKFFFIIFIFCLYSVNNTKLFPFNENSFKLKLKEKKSEYNLIQIEFKNYNIKNNKLYNFAEYQSNYNVLNNNPPLNKSLFEFTNESKNKAYKVNPIRLTILGVVGAGVFTGFHIYYANTWWKDQRDFFKFAADGYYARNMDKVSHIYTANFFTVASAYAYEWAGISPSKSLLYGAITSLAYETYIEINDGFAPNWGFDWGDMGANVFGAIYPFIQEEVNPLQYVNFKWSFKPQWLKKKTENKADLLDDYNNMTFWLSVNPMIALPKSVTKAKFYPNFLSFALGMSITDASHTIGSSRAKVSWILSLDLDVNQLPGKSDFMKKLKKILNFYHFPAPAVRISPSGVWYGLYF